MNKFYYNYILQRIADLYNAATRRIELEIEEREREDNVHHEILDIIQRNCSAEISIFGNANCKKLAEAVYEFLTDRYDSRQWLVIVWDECSKKFYHYQDVTFGNGRFHRVRHISSSLKQGSTVRTFAVSFPLNATLKPFDFAPPNEIPYRPLIGNSLENKLIPKWKRESAGLLVKVLNEMEPRNHYFAMRVGSKRPKGLHYRKLPKVMPIDSPLVRELLAGDHFKVIAFPKEVPNDHNNWEDNVHHKMVSWMEERYE